MKNGLSSHNATRQTSLSVTPKQIFWQMRNHLPKSKRKLIAMMKPYKNTAGTHQQRHTQSPPQTGPKDPRKDQSRGRMMAQRPEYPAKRHNFFASTSTQHSLEFKVKAETFSKVKSPKSAVIFDTSAKFSTIRSTHLEQKCWQRNSAAWRGRPPPAVKGDEHISKVTSKTSYSRR